MHLHEEYISRYNLDIPLIRYDSHSTVFLRSKEAPVSWRVVNIRWRPCHWHPGNFEIVSKKPSHDIGNRFRNVFGHKEVYWDEYEDYILNIVKDSRSRFSAVPKSESSLAVWHMFLLMYDSHIAGLSPKVLNWVADSINPDHSIARKYHAFSQAQLEIHREKYALHECFQNYLQPLTENYAEWLVKLING